MPLLDPRLGLLPIALFLFILGYVLLSWFGAYDKKSVVQESQPADASEDFPRSKIS